MGVALPKPTREERIRQKIERYKAKLKQKKEPNLAAFKKIVQRKVNAYIRERDKDKPCISCGKFGLKMEAGHYWSLGGHSALRYHPDNLNLQCGGCNRWKSGNIGEYRIGLVKRIGAERVQWLDDHRHDEKKWTKEELNEILNNLK